MTCRVRVRVRGWVTCRVSVKRATVRARPARVGATARVRVRGTVCKCAW